MHASDSPPSENRWLWRGLAAALILLSSALHVAYLAHDCPLDLAPDEAHYWDWSRHLDWSYYSKGPLVALLIRGSCALFGPWSEALTGSQVLAVRLPAIACGVLLLVSLYTLTVQALGRERLAFAVVALALTLPPVVAGSTLMTIDAPYTACWGWALVFGHAAAVRNRAWAWPLAGLAVAVGILAKYTMVLWLPSLGLFLLTSREHRRLLLRPGFWVMTAVAALGGLPILYWNARNGWVTFRHVGWQAGVEQRAGWRWLGPLGFVGEQFGLLLGFWFVTWAAALWAYRPWRTADAGRRYLWWLSVPTFGLFLVASLKTSGQLNWPVTAYLSGAVLAAAWLGERLHAPRPGARRSVRLGVAGACLLGLALIVTMHYPALARPLLLAVAGPPTDANPMPLRRFDPTCRLRGWRELGEEIDRARARVRAGGEEPVLAGSMWTTPGLIGFYCDGHPTVHSFGLVVGDRRSQYDFWRPNPLWDPELYRGRTFVLVGEFPPSLFAAFEAVEMPKEVRYAEGGQTVAVWRVMVARGYRGFGPVEQYLVNARH
jgi:hypothetical protein